MEKQPINFASPIKLTDDYASPNWNSTFDEDTYLDFNRDPFFWADVNSDGFSDIVGFNRGSGGFLGIGANWDWAKLEIAFGNPKGDYKQDLDGSLNDTQVLQGEVYHGRIYNHVPRDFADVNGDGHIDLVTFGGNNSSYVHTYLGDGTGVFGTQVVSTFRDITRYSDSRFQTQNENPRLLGDFDGDGKSDVLGLPSGSTKQVVLHGTQDGDFGSARQTSIPLRELGFVNITNTPLFVANTDSDSSDELVMIANGTMFSFGLDSRRGQFTEYMEIELLPESIKRTDNQYKTTWVMGDLDADGIDDVFVSSAPKPTKASKSPSDKANEKFDVTFEDYYEAIGPSSKDDPFAKTKKIQQEQLKKLQESKGKNEIDPDFESLYWLSSEGYSTAHALDERVRYDAGGSVKAGADNQELNWKKLSIVDINNDSYGDLVYHSIKEGMYARMTTKAPFAPDPKDDFVYAFRHDDKTGFDLFSDNGEGPDDDVNNDTFSITSFVLNGVRYEANETVDALEGGRITVGANGMLEFSPDGDFAALEDLENRELLLRYFTKDEDGESSAFVSLRVIAMEDSLHLIGNDHDNVLEGGDSIDRLVGKSGDDELFGNGGDDWLFGGLGGNIFQGGTGFDKFVVEAAGPTRAIALQTIMDYDDEEDVIIVKGLEDLSSVEVQPLKNGESVLISADGLNVVVLTESPEQLTVEDILPFADLKQAIIPSNKVLVGSREDEVFRDYFGYGVEILGRGGSDTAWLGNNENIFWGGGGRDVANIFLRKDAFHTIDGGTNTDTTKVYIRDEQLDFSIDAEKWLVGASSNGGSFRMINVENIQIKTSGEFAVVTGEGALMEAGVSRETVTFELSADKNIVDVSGIKDVRTIFNVKDGTTNELVGGGGDDQFIFKNSYFGSNSTVTGNRGADSYFFDDARGSVEIVDFNQEDALEIFGEVSVIDGYGSRVELLIDSTFTLSLNLEANLSLDDFEFHKLQNADGVVLSAREPEYNRRVNGTSENDVISGGDGIDKIYGFDGDDVLRGEYYDDRLDGGDGDDVLDGGAGSDVLRGGTGDDTAIGGDGEDRIHGQDGNDELHGGDGDDKIFGQDGNDIIEADDGNDKVFGGDDGDRIGGGDGNDWLYGENGKDHLVGGDGNDVLKGGHGQDKLHGGRGDDRIDGGEGNDALSGAAGNDLLWGGAGEDIFEFRRGFGRDTVEDYEVGIDKVNFRGARLEIDDLQVEQVGTHTEISWGTEDTLVLINTVATHLPPEDFIF